MHNNKIKVFAKDTKKKEPRHKTLTPISTNKSNQPINHGITTGSITNKNRIGALVNRVTIINL